MSPNTLIAVMEVGVMLRADSAAQPELQPTSLIVINFLLSDDFVSEAAFVDALHRAMHFKHVTGSSVSAGFSVML